MLTIDAIYSRISRCGIWHILIERHTQGAWDRCFMVYLREHNRTAGQMAFNTFAEALDFVYATIRNHNREGIEYNR